MCSSSDQAMRVQAQRMDLLLHMIQKARVRAGRRRP